MYYTGFHTGGLFIFWKCLGNSWCRLGYYFLQKKKKSLAVVSISARTVNYPGLIWSGGFSLVYGGYWESYTKASILSVRI